MPLFMSRWQRVESSFAASFSRYQRRFTPPERLLNWTLAMPSAQKLDTHHKALTLNLDATTFGSFAEIGAGQEVARWFLLVGAASGTVAKTISAYDKEVSDDLYGSGSRYVSKQRLEAMLDSEWTQLLTQLGKTRGSQTRFFCFVDTVSARNFAGTNDPHGWMGVRFQLQPGGAPNDVLLHINLRDPSNVLQQEAIGILGVNLIYSAFYDVEIKDSFLDGLGQDVVSERVEIDYEPCWSTWFAGDSQSQYFFPRRALLFPLRRFSITKPSCLHRDTSATPIQFTRRFIWDYWLREFKNFKETLTKQNPRPLVFFASPLLQSRRTNQSLRLPTCFVASMRCSSLEVTCCFFAGPSFTS
jgi:hypothetical protein